MIATIKVKIIHPVAQGISKASGNPWTSQTVIAGWSDRTPDGRAFENVQAFTLFGQQVVKFGELGIQQGAEIQAELRFGTRCTSTGRVINDNILYIIDD